MWLTSPDNPKCIFEAIDEGILKDFLLSFDVLNKANPSFRHILWVNDKSLIPRSVKELEPYLEVIEISALNITAL